MKRKTYSAPMNAEVAGSAAKSMVDNLKTEAIHQLVAKHNLTNIDEGDWVSLSLLCDLFNDVTESTMGGASQVFVAMGMKIAEQSEFPPEMLESLTMPIMIMGWNDHYRVNHRGDDLPDIVPQQISETEFELHMQGEEHPYPYDMTYGMLFGFCKKLLPSGTAFKVAYDDVIAARKNWENGTTIRISW